MKFVCFPRTKNYDLQKLKSIRIRGSAIPDKISIGRQESVFPRKQEDRELPADYQAWLGVFTYQMPIQSIQP